jgi:hypothetical protein
MEDRLRRVGALVAEPSTDRPDLILFNACSLADRGEWSEAYRMVDTLSDPDHPRKVARNWPVWPFHRSLSAWCGRILRGCLPIERSLGEQEEEPLNEVLGIQEKLDDLCRHFGVDPLPVRDMHGERLVGLISTRGALERRQKRLDLAEQTAAFAMRLARRFVRDYPEEAWSHELLATACIQQEKNAWKRHDAVAIKDSLIHAIDAMSRAVQLPPPEGRRLGTLAHLKSKLVTLPPDP